MTEYERKREQIGGIILKAMYYGLERSQHWWAKQEHDELPLFADQILSLDGIEIRADSQETLALAGKLVFEPYQILREKHKGAFAAGCHAYRGEMLKPDSEGRVWVKVIPKPKTEEKV